MPRRHAHHRMEEDMAPPNKRRRLADPVSQPSPSRTQLTLEEPLPTLSHTVEQLEQRPSLALLPRPVPQRIEEVHLQIQKRPLADYHDHHHLDLQRRQGTAVSSATDSTLTVTVLQWADITGGVALSTINDDLGGTYATTQTLTLVSSPIPTSTPSSTEATSTESSVEGTPSSTITPSDGFIDSSPSGTGVSSTGASSGVSVTSAASSAGVSAASISGSAASNSTRTDTTRSPSSSASSSSSRVSLGPGVFLATLSDGGVVTITRSDEPYATTFADGRVSTIAPSSSRNRDDDESSRRTTQASDETSETRQSTQQQSTATSVNFVDGPNQTQQSPATGTQRAISSTSSAAGGGGGADDTAPPGTIAGGVVGGCAGLAVILFLALVLLRWWKRKAQNGHHALPPSDFTPDPEISSSLRGQPGMAERAGLRPLVGAVPAFLRHPNRSVQSSAPPSERGFTRVSGRKLPSQFSAGMTSSSPPPPDMPLAAAGARSPDPNDHERNLSATSFYRDSDGFYGGTGVPANIDSAGNRGPFEAHSPSPSESLEGPRGQTPEEMNMTLSPGPQRTPTVHRGGPYTMSPSSTVPSTPAMPLSPAAPSSGIGSPLVGNFAHGTGGGYPRSETPSSVPDERSSRFTEEV